MSKILNALASVLVVNCLAFCVFGFGVLGSRYRTAENFNLGFNDMGMLYISMASGLAAFAVWSVSQRLIMARARK